MISSPIIRRLRRGRHFLHTSKTRVADPYFHTLDIEQSLRLTAWADFIIRHGASVAAFIASPEEGLPSLSTTPPLQGLLVMTVRRACQSRGLLATIVPLHERQSSRVYREVKV